MSIATNKAPVICSIMHMPRAWRVSGVHVLREEGRIKRYAIAFVLRKHGDRWLITEASAGRAM